MIGSAAIVAISAAAAGGRVGVINAPLPLWAIVTMGCIGTLGVLYGAWALYGISKDR